MMDRAEEHMKEFLQEVLGDLSPDMELTPHRFTKAFYEMTSGYREDPERILGRQFLVKHDEMIVVSGIEFVSLCEHHLLPFIGVAHVGYLPENRIIGLSKIPRLVQCFAKRLQLQERLTNQVATALMTYLMPLGAGVLIESQHSCMRCRGIKSNATMKTSCMLGHFRDNHAMRQEFLDLAKTSWMSNIR